MKILPVTNYQNTSFKANSVRIPYKNAIPMKTTAAALLAASAITLAGCSTAGKVVFAYTMVPGGQNTENVNPANDKNVRTQRFVEQLMSMGYIEKKTKTGVNPVTSNEEQYLNFQVKNPITEGYNYQNIEKMFGMPKGSLIESNRIKKGLFDSNDKDLELSCPNRRSLKIFVDYLPIRVQNWLTSTEFQRRWL